MMYVINTGKVATLCEELEIPPDTCKHAVEGVAHMATSANTKDETAKFLRKHLKDVINVAITQYKQTLATLIASYHYSEESDSNSSFRHSRAIARTKDKLRKLQTFDVKWCVDELIEQKPVQFCHNTNYCVKIDPRDYCSLGDKLRKLGFINYTFLIKETTSFGYEDEKSAQLAIDRMVDNIHCALEESIGTLFSRCQYDEICWMQVKDLFKVEKVTL